MASNLLQPTGLQVASSALGLAPNYAAKQYSVLKGYASNIGKGDPVKWGTGTNQGTLVLAAPTDTTIVGIFASVLPFYDQTLQGLSHGLNGSYQSTANPPTGVNVPVLVYDDPFALFAAQVNGGPFVYSGVGAWQGQNINFVANPGPNAAGTSNVALDGTTVGVGNTLPFQIVGPWGVQGGPQDPTLTNPWILVRLNTAQMLAQTGV